MTVQAVRAMRKVDVFFVIGKGEHARELAQSRAAMLAEYVDHDYRVVQIADPPRDRNVGTDEQYRSAVRQWHERRAVAVQQAFAEVTGVGGMLVWGDPSWYDSTLRLVELVRERGADFAYEVIPGVTSAQALAAAHRMVLHEVGQPLHVTTGRRLRADGVTPGVSTLVMLDGEASFTQLPGDDLHIWWAACLGLPDESVISGPLPVVADRIVARRKEIRDRLGWVMDIYLLRRVSVG